jgi:hypothetical protein
MKASIAHRLSKVDKVQGLVKSLISACHPNYSWHGLLEWDARFGPSAG